jgi:hypothetical protein
LHSTDLVDAALSKLVLIEGMESGAITWDEHWRGVGNMGKQGTLMRKKMERLQEGEMVEPRIPNDLGNKQQQANSHADLSPLT